jgi:hypothetical protein
MRHDVVVVVVVVVGGGNWVTPSKRWLGRAGVEG